MNMHADEGTGQAGRTERLSQAASLQTLQTLEGLATSNAQTFSLKTN